MEVEAEVEVWRCGGVEVEVWRCGGVEVEVEVEAWRCVEMRSGGVEGRRSGRRGGGAHQMAAFGARRWALSSADQASGSMVSASSPIRERRVGADASRRRRCLGEDGAWSIRSFSSRPNVVTRTSRPASMRRIALLARSSWTCRLLTTSSMPSFRMSSACERLLHLCRLQSTPVLLTIALICFSTSSWRRWFLVRSINRSYVISASSRVWYFAAGLVSVMISSGRANSSSHAVLPDGKVCQPA